MAISPVVSESLQIIFANQMISKSKGFAADLCAATVVLGNGQPFGAPKFSDLPEQSQIQIVSYGIRQILSDSVARATTESEALAYFATRVQQMADGTLGRRANAKADADSTPAGMPRDHLFKIICELEEKKILARTIAQAGPKPAAKDKDALKAWEVVEREWKAKFQKHPVARQRAQVEFDRRQALLADEIDFDFAIDG